MSERFDLGAERAAAHDKAMHDKEALERQLTAMQEKLLIGGMVLDKATRQEEELRRAQVRPTRQLRRDGVACMHHPRAAYNRIAC